MREAEKVRVDGEMEGMRGRYGLDEGKDEGRCRPGKGKERGEVGR